MECTRCLKEFNIDIPVANIERYHDSVRVACPHCGKLYKFKPILTVEIDEIPDDEIFDDFDYDDWCTPVVKDSEYKKQTL